MVLSVAMSNNITVFICSFIDNSNFFKFTFIQSLYIFNEENTLRFLTLQSTNHNRLEFVLTGHKSPVTAPSKVAVKTALPNAVCQMSGGSILVYIALLAHHRHIQAPSFF